MEDLHENSIQKQPFSVIAFVSENAWIPTSNWVSCGRYSDWKLILHTFHTQYLSMCKGEFLYFKGSQGLYIYSSKGNLFVYLTKSISLHLKKHFYPLWGLQGLAILSHYSIHTILIKDIHVAFKKQRLPMYNDLSLGKSFIKHS